MGACGLSESPKGQAQYFDMDMFLLEKQSMLITSNPTVTKEVEINGKREKVTSSYDSLQWSEELKILWDLNIAAPRYRNAFDQIASEPLTFSRNEEGVSGLQSLVIDKQFIRGEIMENTSIYSNYQHIEIGLNTKGIASITVRGYQKMVLLDTTFYSSIIDLTY